MRPPLRNVAQLAVLLQALAGCAAAPRPRDVPPDVPRPDDVRVVERDGLRLFVDRGCLEAEEEEALLRELAQARARLATYMGAAMAPGDFRPYGTPRPACPEPGPPPLPAVIDVVVVEGGERCHADRDGITLIRDHLPRRDATHEMVHFLAGSSWRPIDEGLAVYLTEHLWGPAEGVPVKVRARAFLDLGVDAVLTPPEVRGGMSRRDYDTAGAFVGWLIEAYGVERFWRLYHGPVRDYHSVYGLAEQALWERFWRYVRNLDVRHSRAYHAYRARLAQR